MITSKENEKIKYLRKLKTKKYRDLENRFLVFGNHLIEEAYKHGEIEEIFTSNPNYEGTLISNELMKELNFTQSPYDILAVCKKANKNINSNKILMLEDVQDPNNLGALLRSASAFGFKHIIISNHSADVYNDKTIRASQGAIFHLKIERTNLIDKIKEYQKLGYKVYATDVNGSNQPQLSNKAILILGNEGRGISESILNLANETITIKTQTVESLNVVIAGSILMYEWSRL